MTKRSKFDENQPFISGYKIEKRKKNQNTISIINTKLVANLRCMNRDQSSACKYAWTHAYTFWNGIHWDNIYSNRLSCPPLFQMIKQF